MTFEDRENLTDLKTFSDEVWFSNDVRFYGNSKLLSNTDIEGFLNLNSSAVVKEVFEKIVVKDTEILNGTVDINIYEGSLIKYENDATGNFSFNFKGELNLSMPNKRSLTVSILCPMGSSAYVITSSDQVRIDGTTYTVKWIGSSSPSSGFTNSINVYTFVLIKNNVDDYTILGSLSRFG